MIEKLKLGELSDSQKRALDEEFGADEVRRLVAELETSDREILSRYAPRDMARSITDRASRTTVERTGTLGAGGRAGTFRLVRRRSDRPGYHGSQSAPNRFGRLLPGIAAAAAIVVVAVAALTVIPYLERSTGSGTAGSVPAAANGVRLKGAGPVLSIYRQSGSSAELLADGAVARTNDVLQIRYNAEGMHYGMILSIDGNRTVTVHLPERGSEAATLQQGQTVTLPYAYRLDNAPAFERFFFVVSDKPFRTAEIVARANVLASQGASAVDRLSLPAGFEQSSTVLKKAQP